MRISRFPVVAGLAALALGGCAAGQSRPADAADAGAVDLPVGTLPATGTISERFLSYNVEMLELTGGRFWKPYASSSGDKKDLYEYRQPIGLENPRLQKLARALGPAYVRYSGTWANGTVFLHTETHDRPVPEGYEAVLTRETWRKAVAFAKQADAEIVTSMPTSAGSRDKDGMWRSDSADRLFAYTASLGAHIAATEFANEPNLIGGTKPPKDYTPEQYRRDFGLFHDWLRKRSPETRILAPGAFELGESSSFSPLMKVWPKSELVSGGEHRPDVVSFHFYGALSQRCSGAKEYNTMAAAWLSAIDPAIATTTALRDQINPGAPIWLTETAETACGANPQARTFEDSFRFVAQLAGAARQGVQVVMHNTLAASDYALLDEKSFAPRPNYWVAYLWRQTMGTTVLDSGAASAGSSLRLYAHCARGIPGGVTVLALNTDRDRPQSVRVPGTAKVFSLTRPGSAPDGVALNGGVLELGAGDTLPELTGRMQRSVVKLDPASITFITIPDAGNGACR